MSFRKLSKLFKGTHEELNIKTVSKQVSIQIKRSLGLYRLPEEYLMLQKTCRDFADAELKPVAAQLDREQKFPKEQIEKLGKLGLLAISVSKKYGGAGQDTLALAVAIEEIARGCGATGSIVSIHNALYMNLLDKCGSHEQKEKYLKPFSNGLLGCFALSEPDAGSDVSAIETTALLDGDYYILNGCKSWVTNASEGKAVVVFATIDKSLKHKGITAFIVPIPSPGLSLGTLDNKLGIRASPTCKVYLDNVRIPKENVLGDIGNGFKIAMRQLEKARVGISAQALGIGQAALEVAVSHAAQRIAFGQSINQMQAVKIRLGDMAVKLEAARLLVWRAAVSCDESERSTKETSMAKLCASEAATFVSHSAIQILGGMGYVMDLPVERHYRDARVTEIYAGVNDVQRILIGESITKEYL